MTKSSREITLGFVGFELALLAQRCQPFFDGVLGQFGCTAKFELRHDLYPLGLYGLFTDLSIRCNALGSFPFGKKLINFSFPWAQEVTCRGTIALRFRRTFLSHDVPHCLAQIDMVG